MASGGRGVTMTGTEDGKDERWHYRVVQSEKGNESDRARSGLGLTHKHAKRGNGPIFYLVLNEARQGVSISRGHR